MKAARPYVLVALMSLLCFALGPAAGCVASKCTKCECPCVSSK